jgi:hypothetical protein
LPPNEFLREFISAAFVFIVVLGIAFAAVHFKADIVNEIRHACHLMRTVTAVHPTQSCPAALHTYVNSPPKEVPAYGST